MSNPPLFVWLHGGPQRQTSIGYHPYLSYAVYDELLEGFVEDGAYVLKVDYTGSWGYGQAFVEALTNAIGKKDVADVLSAVRTFTQTRDIGDIYLIGNSYGGYLAARTLMEDSGLFAGAISINGVTDWYRLATRIPSTPFATLFNGVPEIHNLDQYLNSSIYARVPTDIDENDKILLFHGDRDTSVPAWQSKEFHEVLQNNDKDSRIVELPDTGHIPERGEILESMCEEIDDYFSLALSCR